MGDASGRSTGSGLRWVAGGGLAVLLVGLVVWWIDPVAFAEALADFAWWRFGYCLATGLAVMLLRGHRARLLLPPGPTWSQVMGAVAIGFMASVATPLRMGVVVRPVILKREADVPYGTSTAGLVAERLLDVIALLLLLAWVVVFALPRGRFEGPAFDVAAWGLGSAALLGAGGLVALAAAGPERVRAWSSPLRGRGRAVSFVARGVETFAGGARAMAREGRRSAAAGVVTLLMWGIGMSSAWVVMDGFPDVGGSLARMTTFWASVMTANAAVPTPGSVGAYEAAGIAALATFGVPEALGGAVAVVVHVGAMLAQSSVAAFFLARGGWRGGEGGGVSAGGADGPVRH